MGIEKWRGIDFILAERDKQTVERGYDDEHDEQHDGQQLLIAAGGLLLNALEVYGGQHQGGIEADDFLCEYCDSEEDLEWIRYIVFHRRPDNIEGLAIAGALIAAEIDRLRKEGTA